MQKAGSLQAMVSKGPFGGGGMSDEQLREGQKKLTRYSEFVKAMDAEERETRPHTVAPYPRRAPSPLGTRC